VFLRTGGTEQRLPVIPLRPRPWAIWLADATSGEGKELWHSGATMNDSLPPNAEESLAFMVDGQIVFSSEQDGRNHLYMMPIFGGTPILLTPGDFDVEEVVSARNHGTLLYASNQSDTERRHLWTIRVSEGFVSGKNLYPPKPVALTSGSTAEWHPVMLADGKT